MPATITDPVFGILEFTASSDWKGNFNSTIFGSNFAFTVECGVPGGMVLPEDAQREEFSQYLDSELDLRDALTSAIAAQYLDGLRETRLSWGLEANEKAPYLENNEAIWSLLSNPRLMFGIDDTGAWISWDALWEPEHGITAFISEGQLVGFE